MYDFDNPNVTIEYINKEHRYKNKKVRRKMGDVCKKEMPKAMSNWLRERVNSYQHIKVDVCGMQGYVMKSRDCTVVFFPNSNCDMQFQDIVNRIER